jgi:hypothetical protein
MEHLCQNNKNDFDDFYAIYKASFILSEQKSKEKLLAMLNSSDYTIFIAKLGTKIVGFSIIFHSAKVSFYLLEYMAIVETKRNLGIGSKLFFHAIMQTLDKYGTKPVLIEIDSAQEKSDDKEIRKKRELFYKRFGCRKIEPFDYILPIESSQIAPLMKLLVYHTDMQNILKSQLKRWLKDIYTFVYGCRKDDERIGEMLSCAPQVLKLI